MHGTEQLVNFHRYAQALGLQWGKDRISTFNEFKSLWKTDSHIISLSTMCFYINSLKKGAMVLQREKNELCLSLREGFPEEVTSELSLER